MSARIIETVVDLNECYDEFSVVYLGALRAVRDTPRLTKGDGLRLMHTIIRRVDRCANPAAIRRLTRKCKAVIKRYGQREAEHA